MSEFDKDSICHKCKNQIRWQTTKEDSEVLYQCVYGLDCFVSICSHFKSK